MTTSVRSMVIPFGDCRLLVPTRLVAQIIKLELNNTQPLGVQKDVRTFEMQGKRHLLLDWPGSGASIPKRHQVAVLKALSPESHFPPLSLVVASPPYLLEVSELDIQSSTAIETPLPGYEIMLRHHKLVIPDLFQYIKQLVLRYGEDLNLPPKIVDSLGPRP